MIKLIYIFIFSLLSINCLLFGQLRGGFDVSGEFKLDYDSTGVGETYDSESGIVIGYDEIILDQGELKFGAGLEFMLARGFGNYGEGKGSFHSVYGFGKYSLNEKAYGFVRVGYNFHTGDDDYKGDATLTGENDYKGDATLKGGMMYAFGGGYSLTPTVSFEGLFASHSGKVVTSEDFTIKSTYTRISLGLVFIF
jgi:hypothetical protein